MVGNRDLRKRLVSRGRHFERKPKTDKTGLLGREFSRNHTGETAGSETEKRTGFFVRACAAYFVVHQVSSEF